MQEAPYNLPLAILRRVVVFAAVAVLVLSARPRPVDVILGTVLLASGEALRIWAAGHLDKNVRLVTAGPYRYTRNPLYLGRLLIFTGLCAMARLPFATNWLVVLPIGWAVFFLYYLPRKERVEPSRLRELHGDRFDRYRREVPALLPRFRPWPASTKTPWSIARALRNREHWMVAGLFGVALYCWLRAV